VLRDGHVAAVRAEELAAIASRMLAWSRASRLRTWNFCFGREIALAKRELIEGLTGAIRLRY